VTSTTARDRRDALVERLFGATIGTLELFGVYLGDRLGLYAVLADGDAVDPGELARRTGIAPRYAREWSEALHDTPRPVEVLAALHQMLRDDGSVLLADERVASSFTAPGDEVERMMYGWSISHCLPAAMVDQPAEPTGTVLREPTVRELASRAGFESVEVLPVEKDFFRFYRLRR